MEKNQCEWPVTKEDRQMAKGTGKPIILLQGNIKLNHKEIPLTHPPEWPK